MNMRSGNGPLDALVMAEIGRLRSAETGLERALSALASGRRDEVSELSFLSSLADVRDHARRLERMLEAMDSCGYRTASFPNPAPVLHPTAA